MTLRLILTRHAKSDWSGGVQEDFERPLNARGREEAVLIGGWLQSRGYGPDAILSSAARRTCETAEHIAARIESGLEPAPLETLYGADENAVLNALGQAQGQTVLVVGHNPGIGRLASALVHSQPVHPRFADFPTGATAVIDFALADWSKVAPGLGALRDFTVPDDLT